MYRRQRKTYKRKRFMRKRKTFKRKTFKRSFRRKRFTRKRGSSKNYATRWVTLPNVAYDSVTVAAFPPTALSHNTTVEFTSTNLRNATAFYHDGVTTNMFEMYDAFKVKKARVTWKHSPGPGQPMCSPTVNYSGSYYMQRGNNALEQDTGATPVGAAAVTALPFGRKHSKWGGSRTFYPTTMESVQIYPDLIGTGAAALNQYQRHNNWFMTRNNTNSAPNPNPVNFFGPTLLLPGMDYVGQYIEIAGLTNHFVGGTWNLTISVQVMFKSPRFGWQADTADLSVLHKHAKKTEPSSTKEAWQEEAATFGEFVSDTAKEAAITFGTAAASTAINKLTKHMEL